MEDAARDAPPQRRPAAWGAMYPCEVAVAEGAYGRYVVAQRDLHEGDVVMHVVPYGVVVADTHRKRVCAWCTRWSESGRLALSCARCDAVYFCSEQCLHMAMEPGVLGAAHGRICAGLRRLTANVSSKGASSLLRLVLASLHRRQQECEGAAHYLDLCQPTLDVSFPPPVRPRPPKNADESASEPADDAEDDGTAPLAALQLGEPPCFLVVPSPEEAAARSARLTQLLGSTADSSQAALMMRPPVWADVERLQCHLADWPDETRSMWRKDERLLASVLDDCGIAYSADELLTLVSQVESNCFGLWTARGESYGRGLFPLASFFNHSCDYNCVCERNAAMAIMTIVARRDIPRGTELTIGYIDVDLPVSRRGELLRDFYFTCGCPRCVAERATPGRAKHTYQRSVRSEHRPHRLKKKALYNLPTP